MCGPVNDCDGGGAGDGAGGNLVQVSTLPIHPSTNFIRNAIGIVFSLSSNSFSSTFFHYCQNLTITFRQGGQDFYFFVFAQVPESTTKVSDEGKHK